MLRMISNLVTKYPIYVIVIWVLITLSLLPFTLSISDQLTGELTPPDHSQSLEVQTTIAEQFPNSSTQQLVLTISSDLYKVGTDDFDEAMNQVLNALTDIPLIEKIMTYQTKNFEQLGTIGDDQAAVILSLATTDLETAQEITQTVRTQIKQSDLATQVYVTGLPAVATDLSKVSERDVERAQKIALPLTIILLIIAFGAFISALIPPLVAWSSVILALGGLVLMSHSYPVHSLAQTVVVMLGLAAGIDYTLLMVTRFREEMILGYLPKRAATRTLLTAGKTVMLSGGMVAVSLLALLFPPLNLVRSIGMAGILVILFAVLVSLTLVPAVLALLGNKIIRSKTLIKDLKSSAREEGNFWEKWAKMIIRRPGRWSLLAVLFLLVLTTPIRSIEIYNEGVFNLSSAVESRKGVNVLSDMDLSGILDKINIIVQLQEGDSFYTEAVVLKTAQFTEEMSAYVAGGSFISPTPATIPVDILQQIYTSPVETVFANLDDRFRDQFLEAKSLISDSERSILFHVIPKESLHADTRDPFIDDIRKISEQYFPDVTVLLGGDPISFQDFDHALLKDFPIAIGLVLLLSFIFLLFVYRSIYIAFIAVVGNLLVLGASYGLLVLVFQYWLGMSALHPMVPVIIFAITFGLSMDYQVFLLSRIREFQLRDHSLHKAIEQGLSRTARVITFAALIMGTVFSAFIISDVMTVKMLGFGLFVAILLDATIARLILMPALLALGNRFISTK